MVYPESGLEIEILKAENGRYYVRELTALLFLVNHLYTNLITLQGELNQQTADQIVQSMLQYANSVQSMKWKGYRWRFEQVFIQWSDIDIEIYSCLVPLNCFCDTIVDQYSKLGWSEERWNEAAHLSYTEMQISKDWKHSGVRGICLYKFLALQKKTLDRLLEHSQVSDRQSTDNA